MIMREIKFRGKRVDNGEWVEGNLVMITNAETLKRYPNIVISYNHDTFDWFDVIPKTVGQFTGLTDKNGKGIYEGDLVNCYDDSSKDKTWNLDKEHKGEIVFLDGAFILKCFNGLKKVMGNVDKYYEDFVFLDKWLNAENTEIIGNIHDNPELFK